jgi:hypothetical protein
MKTFEAGGWGCRRIAKWGGRVLKLKRGAQRGKARPRPAPPVCARRGRARGREQAAATPPRPPRKSAQVEGEAKKGRECVKESGVFFVRRGSQKRARGGN